MLFYIKIAILVLLNNKAFAYFNQSEKWRDKGGRTGVAQCISSNKRCIESGEREVDGIKISKDCWKHSYVKKCDFPSNNDCYKVSQCYEIGIKECLVWDAYGNCTNQQKEFSCKERDLMHLRKETIKLRPKGDEAHKIVCKGIHCIDGNCIDKSYKMDEDIMESASKLYAISDMKDFHKFGSEIFRGIHQSCTKKPSEYINCCKLKGWGSALGAKCKSDELDLKKKREKNLCIYVGKTSSGQAPFHVNKHHFCCFSNMLNKVFQIQARGQLGMNFGHGGSANCRGLTLEEVSSLDFNKMDFSEFAIQIQKSIKIPQSSDLVERIKAGIKPSDQELLDKE